MYTSFNSLSELLSGCLSFGSKSLASSYSLLSHLLLMHKYSYIITNISKYIIVNNFLFFFYSKKAFYWFL